MPKVSFILPAYKRRFLHEAIASILAQTYRDFKLVVVDDCSPEDLKSVVDAFHDERLTYHRNAENIGGKDLVAAWNHAMEYARGEWCVLASDDDVYLPRFLEELMKLQEKYPQCDLFHCRIRMIDADGKCIRVGEQRLEYESQLQFAFAIIAKCSAQAMPDFMFRISSLKASGGVVNFPLGWGSDDATWIKLAKNGVCCTSEILFSFRMSGMNISTSIKSDKEKFRARMMYVRWLDDFSRKVEPHSDEDKDILLRFDEDCRQREFSRSLHYLGRLDIRSIVALAREYDLDRAAIRSALYIRFPRLRALRTLLPHWR